MKKIYRIAVVGTGIGEQHLQALNTLKNEFDVACLCTLDRQRGQELADEYALAEVTDDFDQLLVRDDIDVIDICTPPAMHYDMCKRALDAGKHVICEKPLFGSLADCDRMALVLETTDRQLMPVFQYRYGAGLQKLKMLVDEGLAGAAYMTTIETHWWRGPEYYAVDWRGTWAGELGGGFLGHAIHAHDMLTYIHGEIDQISAMGGPVLNDIEVEDNMVASVRMKNGSHAALSMSLASREETSRLRWCFHDLTAESSTTPYTMSRDPWRFVAKDAAHQARVDDAIAALPETEDSYTRQFQLFHASLLQKSTPPVTLADARQSLELITAAYLSNRTGQTIKLPITRDRDCYQSLMP